MPLSDPDNANFPLSDPDNADIPLSNLDNAHYQGLKTPIGFLHCFCGALYLVPTVMAVFGSWQEFPDISI